MRRFAARSLPQRSIGEGVQMNRARFFPPFDPEGSPDAPYAYSQAVRIGDRLETSGQGGWDDDHSFPVALADEIARAFDNLGRVLAGVGASWGDVVSVESWHLPLDEVTYALMVAELRARMPRHRPIWTALAVPGFGLPGMRVEVRVTAVVA
jgi:enamine deaminase RidA (YjgF/YER057c/UK114 family)